MHPFTFRRDEATGDEVLEVGLRGPMLLELPLVNKGSAFPEAERRQFGLLGLLPPHVSSIEEQLARTYENYQRQPTDLERYRYLTNLHDRNEILFFRLVAEHLAEMLPVIYTPSVGAACQRYSHIYERPRGLYLAYPHRDALDSMLANAPVAGARVIVVTDGERILGLGDLGIGGMGIPIGKLILYTLCGGIHPATTLPVVLDVGTDNPELLRDPLYLGWRHERVRGPAYDAFVEAFVDGVRRQFPDVLLQWEDFGRAHAGPLLERYRDLLCSFNDDIQGTGAVTLAGLLTATAVTGARLRDQRVVMLGAGSAALGIADDLVAAMRDEGATLAEARATIWLVDSHGLVHDGRADLDPSKRTYAQPVERLAVWAGADRARLTLAEVVQHVRPTVLLGVAAQPGAFSEPIVRAMARHTSRPIIFPLSNPTAKSEATPADLLAWTAGRALVATGSPFPPVTLAGRVIPIGQCNNAYIFPGVGLGVIAAGARRVSDAMLLAAARALSELAPARHDPAGALYPPAEEMRAVARHVATAVARQAWQDGVAEEVPAADLERRLDRAMWWPRYPRLVPAS